MISLIDYRQINSISREVLIHSIFQLLKSHNTVNGFTKLPYFTFLVLSRTVLLSPYVIGIRKIGSQIHLNIAPIDCVEDWKAL
jgi:hypothetical protein